MTATARAQKRFDEAVRSERLARIEAADDLRRRDRRARAAIRLLVAASTLVVIGMLTATAWAAVSRSSAQRSLDAANAARAGAVTAIETMLTADPARAEEYVTEVLDVTTGEQHERLADVRDELRATIAGLGAPSTGRVIAAGVQGDTGDQIGVLVLAQASEPELVGGVRGSDRVAVRVVMQRSGDRWLVSSTERAS